MLTRTKKQVICSRATVLLAILGVVILALCLPVSGAEENNESLGYESHDSSTEVAEIQAEVEALREQFMAQRTSSYGAVGGCGGDCGCGGCGSGCVCQGCGGQGCCTCYRSCGWFFGGEISWLKAFHNSGTGFTSPFLAQGMPGVGQIDTDYETSGRYWIGSQCCNGLGWRARYWEYDHMTVAGVPANTTGFTNVFHSWDTWALDVELIDSTKLGCNWDATFSIGLRYVEYEEFVGATAGNTLAAFVSNTFSGVGLTTGLELRRQLTCNLGLVGSVRGSVLADDEENAAFTLTPPTNVSNRQISEIKSIYEGKLGLEYVCPICSGGYYFVRAGGEVQYWDSFGVDTRLFAPGGAVAPSFQDGSIGFAGFTLAVGLQR